VKLGFQLLIASTLTLQSVNLVFRNNKLLFY